MSESSEREVRKKESEKNGARARVGSINRINRTFGRPAKSKFVRHASERELRIRLDPRDARDIKIEKKRNKK